MDYPHALTSGKLSLSVSQLILFSGGGGGAAAACTLSLAFRVPLGVISTPTDPRQRFSTENTNVKIFFCLKLLGLNSLNHEKVASTENCMNH